MSQEKLSICTKCIDHVAKIRQVESEGKLHAAERYVMSKCTPLPDELALIVVRDDKFEKVPRTNSALRHSLLASCTFKCLTVFSIRHSSTKIQSTYFSLSGYELASEVWQLDMLYNASNKLKNLNFGHAECHLANTKQALNRGLKNLLFFLEFLINDGVCLLYKGNCSPGRSSRKSLLDREHASLDSWHKNVHRLLDEFGKVSALPRSSVQVDKDFYICGGNGCIK